MIQKGYNQTYKLMPDDSISIISIIEKYLRGEGIKKI